MGDGPWELDQSLQNDMLRSISKAKLIKSERDKNFILSPDAKQLKRYVHIIRTDASSPEKDGLINRVHDNYNNEKNRRKQQNSDNLIR